MRPMDHMDYEDEMETIDPNSWVTTYAEFLQDLIWYLESDGNKISETEGLTEFQQTMLWDYLVSTEGNPITVKDVGFQIPIYSFDTSAKGIEKTFDILLDALYQKFCKERKVKYKKTKKTIYYNAVSTVDIDDYLDGLAAISKPNPPEEIKVVISPVPENIDEAMEFLKGLT